MTQLFWIEPSGNCYSYADLVREATNARLINSVQKTSNQFELWATLLASILHDSPISLVDSDCTEQELERFGISSEQKVVFAPPEISLEDLRDGWRPKRWRLTLFTSGTTGRPKSVAHSLESLTRNVRLGARHQDDVWAFCYHPTHFAGIQVFLQALLNLNPMIFLFGSNPDTAWEEIRRFNVTHLSATPTFLRNLMVANNPGSSSIRSITFGGERFDPALAKKLNTLLPLAKIRNIYASTEAGSLLASDGESWEIPTHLQPLVRISSENELLVHKSLLGDFHGSSLQEGQESDWFQTGDKIEQLDDRKFRIVGRAVELINVGGYKINPHEIEQEIRMNDLVRDCRVWARKNSVTGQIICADVVLRDETDQQTFDQGLRKHLSSVLQPWKQPRIIRYVEKIELSRTGKVIRK